MYIYYQLIISLYLVTGDKEVAPVFVKRLLPIFAQVYTGTLVYSVRYELSTAITCHVNKYDIRVSQSKVHFAIKTVLVQIIY